VTTDRDGVEAKLVELCVETFLSMRLPLAPITASRVRRLCTESFTREGKARCYVITVETPNPAMLRGSTLAYKGSYKERVEAVIQHYLDHADAGASAHIEIIGPQSGSIDGLLPLQLLVGSGKATPESPVVEVATLYDIPYALVRGRHVIGPSPAVAEIVREAVRTSPINTMLDLFAGTGIASKVACIESTPNDVTLVEHDPQKLAALKTHLDFAAVSFREENVLTLAIDRPYDLVVADPFYEHVLDLLDTQGETLAAFANRLILASGSVEDLQWNRSVRNRLVSLGFSVRRLVKFGQVLFDAVRNTE
jgi:16S rRNA G966 N2-methylase RsmD